MSNPLDPSFTKGDMPVGERQRLVSLDLLRGVAVLGILVMNVQSFAMPSAAYLNPTAYGDLTATNFTVWWLSHLFFDQKFITIFSLLFGAGIVLMVERSRARERAAAGLHYRRMLWLLVLGLLHGYGLWYGDILVVYAICGMIVYPAHRLPSGWLLAGGVLLLALGSAISLLTGWSLAFLSPAELSDLEAESWRPPADALAAELATYRGGWFRQLEHRVPTTFFMQTFLFLFATVWRVAGSMLLGMCAMKWRVVSGGLSRGWYVALAVTGLGIGLPLVQWGVQQNLHENWSVEYSFFIGSQFNHWGSLLMAGGYIGVVMLIARAAGGDRSQTAIGRKLWPLVAVGRLALTNYLLQTVICTTIFYGHGLGWFGSVGRTGQAGIVLLVWLFQLVASPLWLTWFRIGPAEWCWRCLDYWQPLPLRRDDTHDADS